MVNSEGARSRVVFEGTRSDVPSLVVSGSVGGEPF